MNLYEIKDFDFIKGLLSIPGMSNLIPEVEDEWYEGLREWLSLPGNTVITDGQNAITFEKLRKVSYEVHFLFQKQYRGKYAIKTAPEMFRFMVNTHGAKTFLGTVPKEDKATRLFCKLIGCREIVTVDRPSGEGVVFQYIEELKEN